MAEDENGYSVQMVDAPAIELMNRSELEAQVATAHRWPRSITKFQADAKSLATLTRPIAESCMYALKRGDKIITGPSVRLAEICLSSFGNMHAGARVLDAEERHVMAQGVAWDMEKNVRVTIEAKRRITDRNGRRFNDDMITTTGSAAAAIAFRNAVFKVIPRALVDVLYADVKTVAVGDRATLVQRRDELLARLQKRGVTPERIFARIGKKGIADIDLEDVEVLIGLGTAIASHGMSVDEAFPAPDDTAAKAKALEHELTNKAERAKAQKEASDAVTPATDSEMSQAIDQGK